MVALKLSYEEIRLKRIEENKQRMEALNLPKLTNALRTPLKSTPMKKFKPRTTEKQLVVVRRSSRLANVESPVYKEILVDRVEIPRRIYKRRDFPRVYASDSARVEATEKAEKLQAGLESNYPSFVRSMLPSHVSGGFWLGLSSHFCKTVLPKRDDVITLIDEDGDEYPTIFLAKKTGLSGGWKGFAVAHDLKDGDALVFHLIRPTAFKVYIIRSNSAEEGSNCES